MFSKKETNGCFVGFFLVLCRLVSSLCVTVQFVLLFSNIFISIFSFFIWWMVCTQHLFSGRSYRRSIFNRTNERTTKKKSNHLKHTVESFSIPKKKTVIIRKISKCLMIWNGQRHSNCCTHAMRALEVGYSLSKKRRTNKKTKLIFRYFQRGTKRESEADKQTEPKNAFETSFWSRKKKLQFQIKEINTNNGMKHINRLIWMVPLEHSPLQWNEIFE